MPKSNYMRRKKWLRWGILVLSIPSIFFLFHQFQAFNHPEDKKRDNMVNQLLGYQKTQGELFELEKWQLANGAQVHFVEAPTLPMVDVLLTFDAVKKIAIEMKERKSLSRELKGTVKEVLGSCLAVGITVDGKSPKEVTKEVEEGKFQI